MKYAVWVKRKKKTFDTLQAARDFADSVFKATGIVLGIEKVGGAKEKLAALSHFSGPAQARMAARMLKK